MTEALTTAFVDSIARCLAQTSGVDVGRIVPLVERVLGGSKNSEQQHPQPDRGFIQSLQDEITAVLGDRDQIDLVLGGATKIKGYVFEAPKLPEIRGASTLLDWVNEVELPALWGADTAAQWPERGIVYAGGGGFLAFAPHRAGEERARRIEQSYTEWTLNANSSAAAGSFRLIELRYGRDPLGYWVDDFLQDWAVEERREQLKRYYYSPSDESVEPGQPPRPTEDPRDRFFRRKTFGELVTLLTTKTSRRRDERPFDQGPSFYVRQPWDERCDSSEQRPAAVSANIEDGERRLSLPTARKAIVGRLVKDQDHPAALELASDPLLNWQDQARQMVEAEVGWDRRWREYLKCNRETPYARAPYAGEAEVSHDVHDIAAGSRYIAMIYADGNNVGRTMATLATPQAYAAVSEDLRQVMRDAVFGALARHLQPQPGAPKSERTRTHPYVHPFEILAVGGDDLLLIVPGAYAFDVALEIAQRFEQGITARLNELDRHQGRRPPEHQSIAHRSRYQRDLLSSDRSDQADQQIADLRALTPRLGLSAGVVVAREDAPIFFLRNLVEELLKSAKKQASAQARAGYYGGAVDFMVLKSITMVTDNIAEFRKAGMEHEAGHERRRLYARPYAWHELAGLLRTVRALRQAGLPRSQLYRLGDTLEAALQGGLNASMLEYLFSRTRMQPRHSEPLALHVEHAWHASGEGALRLPPWILHGGRTAASPTLRETIWLDMLEIYDLVAVDKEPLDGHD